MNFCTIGGDLDGRGRRKRVSSSSVVQSDAHAELLRAPARSGLPVCQHPPNFKLELKSDHGTQAASTAGQRQQKELEDCTQQHTKQMKKSRCLFQFQTRLHKTARRGAEQHQSGTRFQWGGHKLQPQNSFWVC
jgi:hypothetical protein